MSALLLCSLLLSYISHYIAAQQLFTIPRTYDLSQYSNDQYVAFTVPITSSINDGKDVHFSIESTFINGWCSAPQLSFKYLETHRATSSYAWLKLYVDDDSFTNLFTICNSFLDTRCSTWVLCLNQQDLNLATTLVDFVQIGIKKSSYLTGSCSGRTMVANLTISCRVAASPTKEPTSSPHTTADSTSYSTTSTTADIADIEDDVNTDGSLQGNNGSEVSTASVVIIVILGVLVVMVFLALIICLVKNKMLKADIDRFQSVPSDGRVIHRTSVASNGAIDDRDDDEPILGSDENQQRIEGVSAVVST